MGRGGFQGRPGRAEQAQHVGGVVCGRRRVGDQRFVGGRRRVVQRIGVGQPLGLGLQVEILAFERLEPLDLFQPVPQVLGFPRPLAGAGNQLIELTSDLQVPLVDPLVVAEQSGELGAERTGPARPAACPA